jgi:hypothetical protein
MIFTTPQWNPSKNSYKIEINSNIFNYTEIRNVSSGDAFFNTVDITSNTFQEIINTLSLKINEESKLWFASPIKPHIFIKKTSHIFDEVPLNLYTYGNAFKFTWTPISLEITPKTFEIKWNFTFLKINDTSTSINSIDFAEDLEETQPRTIVIQQNDIIENVDIPFDISEQPIHQVSSRAIIKQKVRQAKLKAAIATMKAERMAEKYFRRYGVQTELGSDSDLSINSEEEETDEDI